MKTRKILALLMAVLMLVGCMAACGGNETETPADTTGAVDATEGTVATGDAWSAEKIAQYGEAIKAEAAGNAVTLKVWAPEAAKAVFEEQTAAFVELFKDYADIKIEVAVQGENDAAAAVLNDAKSAADVFGFPSDQIDKLYNANTLAKVLFADEATAANTPATVAAASKGGELFAYPETGDNSYILVYDKRLVSDDQAKSWEGVFEACKTADKKFIMDAKNGFFACTFLYTGGLKTEGFEDDGMTQKFNAYDIAQVTASVKAYAELFKSAGKNFESAATDQVVDGFKNGTVAAGIAGAWNIAAIKDTLGDNAGYAIMPTININGTATQSVNMFGYKFLGVNSQSKFPGTSQVLAHYLTNEECQLKRVEALEWGPSNANVQNNDIVKNNPSMSALMAQTEYSVPQTGLAGTFWDPLAALGTYMCEPSSDLSDAALQKEVEACITGIRDE